MHFTSMFRWGKLVVYYFTYTEWACFLWWHLAIGICLAYGRWYEFTLPMYAFLGCSWFLLILVFQGWRRNKQSRFIHVSIKNQIRFHGGRVHYSQVLGLIIIGLLMVCAGYARTEAVIYDYKGRDMSYLRVPAYYVVHVESRPELSVRQGESQTIIKGTVVGLIEDEVKTNVAEKRNTNKGVNDINRDVNKALNHDININFKKASGAIQVYIKSQSLHIAGSYILVKGTVLPVSVLPEEGRIDMRARYISQKRVGTMYDGEFCGVLNDYEVEALIGQSLSIEMRLVNMIERSLGRIHDYARGVLQQYLPEDLSHLSESLLLGGGYGVLDDWVVGAFSKTGLIHILSVSGSHIALLFSFVFFMARLCKVGSLQATYSAIAIVIVYCGLVGYNPPVVRSALMGIVMGVGLILQKEYASLQALHLTALGLLVYDPMQLFDISFQLSFGATYGIMLFARPLYQSLWAGMPYIMGPISLCVSAQLLIMPLQLYYFHMVGIGSLLAAIVVAPLLDLAIIGLLVLLSITAVLSIFGVGSLVGWCWSLLGALLNIALFLNETIAMMPGMVYWSAALSLGRWIVYGGLLYILYYFMKRVSTRKYNREYGIYFLLILLVCSANMGLWEAGVVQVHTVPLSRGAAIIVMKKEWFNKPKALIYIDLNKKELSSYSRGSIVNACHYYGITKPEAIVFKDTFRPLTRGSVSSKSGLIKGLVASNSGLYSMLEMNQSEEDRLISELKCQSEPIERLQQSVWQVGRSDALDAVLLEKTDVLHLVGMTKSYLFCHRQTGKKTLKLDEDKLIILGTADPNWLLQMEDVSFVEAVVFTPSFKGGAEIDPADDKVYMTGAYIIPDFLL